MKHILHTILVILLFSNCSNNKNNNEVNEDESIKIKAENVNKNAIPSEIGYKGTIFFTKKWDDKNGGNIFILSVKTIENTVNYNSSVYLYGYHYANQKLDNYTLLREIKDMEENCEFDLTYNFFEDKISIRDDNSDGYAEITFAYSLNCSSDVSPDRLKLLMLENGEKYAIRGYIPIYLDDSEFGGVKNIDAVFNNASSELLNYAENLWDEIVADNYRANLKLILEYEIRDLKAELGTAEDILEDIQNKTFLSINKKERKLKEQYLTIEDLKKRLEEQETMYNTLQNN